MKKLITLFTLFLAFTITANAQDKKVSNENAAKQDIAALIEKVTIGEDLKKDMYTLMVMKHEALSNSSLTPAKRESISANFEHKIMSGLDEAQRKILSSNPELLKKLSH